MRYAGFDMSRKVASQRATLSFTLRSKGVGWTPYPWTTRRKGPPPPPLSPPLPSPDHMVPSFHLDRGWFSEWLNIVIVIIIIIVVIRLPKRSFVYDLLMFLMFDCELSAARYFTPSQPAGHKPSPSWPAGRTPQTKNQLATVAPAEAKRQPASQPAGRPKTKPGEWN